MIIPSEIFYYINLQLRIKFKSITLLMIFLRMKIHFRIIIELLVSPYNIEYFLQMDTAIGEQFSLSYKPIS